MNLDRGTTPRAYAGREAVRGVRVKSLVELQRTKSFDRKTTLLDFLEARLSLS